jgi:hypothetical protein
MAKVNVTIDPKTHEVKYEVQGVQGGTCTDLTKVLTQSNEVLDMQYTEEYCSTDTLPDYVEEMADAIEKEHGDE